MGAIRLNKPFLILLKQLAGDVKGGLLTITVRGRRFTGAQDTGAGIPPENLGSLFEPYQTTKRRKWAGSDDCATDFTDHGGKWKSAADQQGTTFVLLLIPGYQAVSCAAGFASANKGDGRAVGVNLLYW